MFHPFLSMVANPGLLGFINFAGWTQDSLADPGRETPMAATVEGRHTCLKKDGRVSRLMLEFSLSALTVQQ